jgi:hypothetical protein
MWAIFQGIRRPGHEADHSIPFSNEVLPYVFMALSTGTATHCSYPEAINIYIKNSQHEIRWLNAFISYFSTHREREEGGKKERKRERKKKRVLAGSVGTGLWVIKLTMRIKILNRFASNRPPTRCFLDSSNCTVRTEEITAQAEIVQF